MKNIEIFKYQPGTDEIDYKAMVDDIFEDRYIFKITASWWKQNEMDSTDKLMKGERLFHSKVYSIETRKKFDRSSVLQELSNMVPCLGQKLKQENDDEIIKGKTMKRIAKMKYKSKLSQ